MNDNSREKLAELESRVVTYAVKVLTRRISRLEKRRFVLCPWLRAKWILRKISKIKDLTA